MITTVTLLDANIIINGLSLEDLLSKVYNKGIVDGKNEFPPAKVTFGALSKELQAQERKISPRTLAGKAKAVNNMPVGLILSLLCLFLIVKLFF